MGLEHFSRKLDRIHDDLPRHDHLENMEER